MIHVNIILLNAIYFFIYDEGKVIKNINKLLFSLTLKFILRKDEIKQSRYLKLETWDSLFYQFSLILSIAYYKQIYVFDKTKK